MKIVNETLSFTKKIIVKNINATFPRDLNDEEKLDFDRWVSSKAMEVGTGRQCEYYGNIEDIGDIEVKFHVTYE